MPGTEEMDGAGAGAGAELPGTERDAAEAGAEEPGTEMDEDGAVRFVVTLWKGRDIANSMRHETSVH